ncbi:hypothetical protein PENSPDRAFT_665799 [Peniophora sp. CONT]|nr:hypothetical protein PENSPDRAFT_665799 [Peniophora sp. CONT]
MESSPKPPVPPIHRLPLELWAIVIAYTNSRTQTSPSQTGQRLLPVDCLSCGRLLLSPKQYEPTIITLSQVDKHLRLMAFGLGDAWAANALAIPARFEDALTLIGEHRALHLGSRIGICEHILLLLGPHLSRAATLKTSLPSHCSRNSQNSSALYIANHLQGAYRLTDLQLFFDAAVPPDNIERKRIRLPSLRKLRLQNSPVLFWSPRLTDLDLATEVPELTWTKREVLDVLRLCSGLRYLTLQLAMVQDDEYIWMSDPDSRPDPIELKCLRVLCCDCRDYELATLLFALRVPSRIKLHYGHFGEMGAHDADSRLEREAQVGVTLAMYRHPQRGREIMESLLNGSDDTEQGDVEDEVLTPTDERSRHDSSHNSGTRSVQLQGDWQGNPLEGSEDEHPDAFWASAGIAGLDIHISGQTGHYNMRRPDFCTLIQGSQADDVHALLNRSTHPKGLREDTAIRSITLHDINLLDRSPYNRDCLPGESPFEVASDILWQYRLYVGTDNITHIIIGRYSALPQSQLDWHQLLQHFENAERIEIDGRALPSQAMDSLASYLSEADQLRQLTLIIIRDSPRGALDFQNAMTSLERVEREIKVAWTFVTTT